MTSAFRLDRVDQQRLAAVAEQARTAQDIPLPGMPVLNMSPCSEHVHMETPQSWCRRCGLASRRHQRVAGTWLFFARKGLLADPCGSGKTASATLAIAMAFQAGELNPRKGGGRALVVCRPPVTGQWAAELARFVPSLRTVVAEGTPKQRGLRYAEPWDLLVIGQQTFLRDKEIVNRLGIKHVIFDDIDPLRHAETATAWAAKALATNCHRVIILSATPLQKKLEELYDVLSIIGGKQVFGSKTSFLRRYTRTEKQDFYTGNPNRGKKIPGTNAIDKRSSIKRTQRVTAGYRNLGEFKALLAPFVLRRRIDDLDDVSMPALQSHNVFLDLYPSQRARYTELQDGVLREVKNQASQIRSVKAIARLVYGSQICESLAAIDDADEPDNSVKFDWLMDHLLGDWGPEENEDGSLSPGEKVIVFIQYKNGVRALQRRLDAESVGHVTVWGEERGDARNATVQKFWDDPSARVLIGTAAIEQSLNLQVARHLVNVDQLINPARMTQLAGRIRRDGSRFRTVYVHNLLTVDTHEERILRKLETEAALSGAVWNEEDPIYAQLSPLEMMQLIAPSAKA